jgi:NAD-dependent SIR2 family protein deacetylase
LAAFDLKDPLSIFDTRYFRKNPKPFFTYARELWPSGQFRPTPSHYFIRVLAEQGLLLRNFTQNFDGLERIAGVPAQRLIEAHGTFSSAECIECNREYPADYVKHAIFADPPEIPQCKSATCNKGIVRPKVVFFGDRPPDKFHKSVLKDFPRADLVIVMGTSLQVRPFCDVLSKIKPNIPRLFLNNEHIEGVDSDFESVCLAQYPSSAASSSAGSASRSSVRISRLSSTQRHPSGDGLPTHRNQDNYEFTKTNSRTVFLQDSCDNGVMKMASMIGCKFATRLRQLIAEDAWAHACGGVRAEHESSNASKREERGGSGGAGENTVDKDSPKRKTKDRRVCFMRDVPEQNAATLSNAIVEGVARAVSTTFVNESADPVFPPQRFVPDRTIMIPVISRIAFRYIPKLKWSDPRWLLFTAPAAVSSSIRIKWCNVHQLHVHRVHGFDQCPRLAHVFQSWAFQQHDESIKELCPLTNDFVSVCSVHAASTETNAQAFDIDFSNPRLHFLSHVDEGDDDDDTQCCFKAESYITVFGD